MVCRDKTYVEGETYTEDDAVLCERGMHACLAPIDVLSYYPPSTSVYHVVEVGDDVEGHTRGDSKVVTKTLSVLARLGIPDIVNAQVDYTVSRATTELGGHATGESGAASATGWSGAASADGAHSVAMASGHDGRAKGELGCALFLAERDPAGKLVAAAAVIVGRKKHGIRIEPDTWYSLRDGRLVEVSE